MAFLPFFEANTIPSTIKAVIAFYLAIIFYPLATPIGFEPTASSVVLAVVTEVSFGFIMGFIIKLIFAGLLYAGEIIAFIMGFSMASTIDPSSGVSQPILSQFLNSLALILFLMFDGHHLLLLLINHTIGTIDFGAFTMTDNLFEFIQKEFINIFVMGFTMSFPIIALSILSDIIFGMIMKTVPSFNLLVIGFPAKVIVAFVVFIAIFSPIMLEFKDEFFRVYYNLQVMLLD